MGKRPNLLILVTLMVIAALGLGCAHSVNIAVKREPISFKERPFKLPLNAGLFLDEKDRNYVISTPVTFGGTYKFMVGEALEPNAGESLKKVFKEVSVIKEKDSVPSVIDRIVTIRFGPTSKLVLGATTLSRHTSEIELICEIYDKNWNLLWKGTSVGRVCKSTLKKGLVPGIFGVPILQRAVGGIVNDGLVAALEQLNEQILRSGKDSWHEEKGG